MATRIHCSCPLISSPYKPSLSSTSNGFLGYPTPQTISKVRSKGFKVCRKPEKTSTPSTSGFRVRCGLLPVDPWAPNIDSQSIASQLFAASLFPYLVFLYYITKSKIAPKLTLVGFYFLLAFVGATSKHDILCDEELKVLRLPHLSEPGVTQKYILRPPPGFISRLKSCPFPTLQGDVEELPVLFRFFFPAPGPRSSQRFCFRSTRSSQRFCFRSTSRRTTTYLMSHMALLLF